MPSSSECGQLAKSGAEIGLMTTCCPSDQFCHSFDYCPNVAIGFLSLGKVQNFHRQIFALSGSILKNSKPMLYIKVYIGMKDGNMTSQWSQGRSWTFGQYIRGSELDNVSEVRGAIGELASTTLNNWRQLEECWQCLAITRVTRLRSSATSH